MSEGIEDINVQLIEFGGENGVQALVKLFEELGGEVRLNTPVKHAKLSSGSLGNQHIITDHKGDIKVANGERGAEFLISIPVEQESLEEGGVVDGISV